MFDNLDLNPDRGRGDDRRSSVGAATGAEIGRWLEQSAVGATLKEAARELLCSYTPKRQLDMLSTEAESCVALQHPSSLVERGLNAFGIESVRQRTLQTKQKEAQQRTEFAQALNQDIECRSRHLIEGFVDTNFEKSPNLTSLLSQVGIHLNMFEERRAHWEEIDQEATRMAGDAHTIALSHEFNSLPEFVRNEIREHYRRGRDEQFEMYLKQAAAIAEWNPTPSTLSELYLRSKDKTLTLPISLPVKDTVRAFRSVLSTGRPFFSELAQDRDGSIEDQIKADILIGALVDLKAHLKSTQQLIAEELKDLQETILKCLLPS